MVTQYTTICGCIIGNWGIDWCHLHANAEAVAKQRDQLLDALRHISALCTNEKMYWASVIKGAKATADAYLELSTQPAAETTEGHLHQWDKDLHNRPRHGPYHDCEVCSICAEYRCEVELDWQPQKQEA